MTRAERQQAGGLPPACVKTGAEAAEEAYETLCQSYGQPGLRGPENEQQRVTDIVGQYGLQGPKDATLHDFMEALREANAMWLARMECVLGDTAQEGDYEEEEGEEYARGKREAVWKFVKEGRFGRSELLKHYAELLRTWEEEPEDGSDEGCGVGGDG